MIPNTFIDSHCHLESNEFDSDRNEIINAAKAAGVSNILIPGTDLDGSNKSLNIATQYDGIFAAAGIHPHDAAKVPPNYLKELKKLLKMNRVIALGEIGLDYHYDFSPREVQKKIFSDQVKLAQDIGKPLIIHTRKSIEDTFSIMDKLDGWKAGGVFHCFPGNHEEAEYIINKGMYLSFTGVITFKNAESLRQLISDLPIEKLLLETDSPYMAPVPYRGKRNQPAYVIRIAETIAEIKKIDVRDVAKITSENFKKLFKHP